MGSPGGCFSHLAAVPKPEWKGSEDRTEAVNAACLPQHLQAAAFDCSSWGMHSSAFHPLQFCPDTSRSLGTKRNPNPWSQLVFIRTLSNSTQLPALQMELSLLPRAPQPARHVQRACKVYGRGMSPR